jgi:hypothetical protein
MGEYRGVPGEKRAHLSIATVSRTITRALSTPNVKISEQRVRRRADISLNQLVKVKSTELRAPWVATAAEGAWTAPSGPPIVIVAAAAGI